MNEVLRSVLVVVGTVLVLVGGGYFERRRWMKKAKQEQDATLKRMEAEFIRIANKMQVEHEEELAKLANSQHMKALIEPVPVYINQFLHNQSDFYN